MSFLHQISMETRVTFFKKSSVWDFLLVAEDKSGTDQSEVDPKIKVHIKAHICKPSLRLRLKKRGWNKSDHTQSGQCSTSTEPLQLYLVLPKLCVSKTVPPEWRQFRYLLCYQPEYKQLWPVLFFPTKEVYKPHTLLFGFESRNIW